MLVVLAALFDIVRRMCMIIPFSQLTLFNMSESISNARETVLESAGTFLKLRTINEGVPAELVDDAIVWLCSIGSRAVGFRSALEAGYFYKITPSPNYPNGIQVWCNQDGGSLSGGATPNHELWRKPNGDFDIKQDLNYF